MNNKLSDFEDLATNYFQRNPNKTLTKNISCSWNDVAFYNYHVEIKTNPGLYIPCNSRKSFELLREFIINKNPDPLNISISVNKANGIQPENINELEEGIKQAINIIYRDEDLRYYKSLKDIVAKDYHRYSYLIPEHVQLDTNENNKFCILDILLKKHNEFDKIISIREFFELGDQSVHDSFIFTLKFDRSRDYKVIIWETPLKGFATHVFICKREQYAEYIKKIVSFLSSDIKNKRQRLKNNTNGIAKDLNYTRPINHTSYWYDQLINFLASDPILLNRKRMSGY